MLETSSGIIGIEIKSRAALAPNDIRSLKMVAEKLGARWRGGMVIHPGHEIKPIGEPGLFAVPSYRLFQRSDS